MNLQGYDIRIVKPGHRVHRDVASKADDGGLCVERITLTVDDDSAVVDGGTMYVTQAAYRALWDGQVQFDVPPRDGAGHGTASTSDQGSSSRDAIPLPTKKEGQ